MSLRSNLIPLTALVLLTAPQVAFGQSAWGYFWCADGTGNGRYDLCYYDARQSCHVTMSGLGVCIPRTPDPSLSGRRY
jgi:hypothetical protein